MTRFGWGVLIVILLVVGAFLSVTSFGGSVREARHERITRPIPRATMRPSAMHVPVAGVKPAAIQDSWGDPRVGGSRGHRGIDIAAPHGTPVLAAAEGTVEKLFNSRLGGTTLYVRSPDRRWIYYYAHLADYAPRMVEGRPIRAGERVGFVGDTGDAGQGNYHLHFGMQRMRPGEGWWQGEDVNPYPLLAGTGQRR